METKVFVERKNIEIEYELADDCKLFVRLSVEDAENLRGKLDKAIFYAGPGLMDFRDFVE